MLCYAGAIYKTETMNFKWQFYKKPFLEATKITGNAKFAYYHSPEFGASLLVTKNLQGNC